MSFKFYMKSKLLVSLVILLVFSCKKENQLENDIAKINTDIKVERFDALFAKVTPNGLSKLKTAYPFMFSNKVKDSFWLAKKEDTLQVELFHEVDKTFANFEGIEFEIESLFNHLKYYFPEFNPPRIITTTNDVDYRNKVIVS